MSKLVYRKAIKTDLDYLIWLRKETMGKHLVNSGVLLNEDEQLLRVTYLFDQAEIVTCNGENIGLLKLDESENAVEIVQIQIDPKFQGKGFGQQIIKEVINDSLAKGKKTVLSVLKENPAKALYLRIGFKIIGEDDLSFKLLFDELI